MQPSIVGCILVLLAGQSYSTDSTVVRSSVFYVQTSPASICKRRSTARANEHPVAVLPSFTPPLSFYLDPSPSDIRVQRINETTIQIFWTPIYYPHVERYIIHYSDKSENKPENQWALYSPIDPAAKSATISGLKPAAMYNVRVSAEFSSATNANDPTYAPGLARREGDLSEIHVADIFRRE